MQFQFSFKQMDVSDSLRSYAEGKIVEVVERFVGKPVDAHITFSIDRHNHTVRCTFAGGDGFQTQVEHTSDDMYASVDAMVAKLETQLKKKKEKIKSHKGNSNVRSIAGMEQKRPSGGSDSIDAEDILKYEAARKKMTAKAR